VSALSLEAFVAERSTDLLRTAYLLTGDRGSALDLLETALITTVRHWKQVPDDATAFARRALVAAHGDWRRRARLDDLIALSPMLSGLARPASGVERRDATNAALAQLPARTRAALVLRYGEGLSETATAEVLDCPAGAVATSTARGLARLGELLGDTTTTGDAGTRGVPDAAVVARLRRELGARAADVEGVPDGFAARVLDGYRTQRRHRAALLVLAAVLVAIVVLVALTVDPAPPTS
jgi:RNA polymerase sigma factor (sigma-70 family)